METVELPDIDDLAARTLIRDEMGVLTDDGFKPFSVTTTRILAPVDSNIFETAVATPEDEVVMASRWGDEPCALNGHRAVARSVRLCGGWVEVA